MMSSLTNINFSSFRLHRLVRRQSIDSAVLLVRTAVIVIGVLLLVLAVQRAVSSFFATRVAIAQLEGDATTALEPPPISTKTTISKVDSKIIANSKIFGELGAPVAPVTATAPKPPSQLALQLIGTFISGGQTPYAIIEDTKKKGQDVFVINDDIFGQAKLKAIMNDRVEIEREGRLEYLKLDDTPDESVDMKGGVGSVGDNQYVVEEGELDKALENLPLLLTQARAVPYFKDGKSIGLRMFAIRSGSIFEKIGLRNGDILKSINGQNLGDLSQAMKLFERLKQERSLSLMLERSNEEKEFKYEIK